MIRLLGFKDSNLSGKDGRKEREQERERERERVERERKIEGKIDK